MFSCAIYWFFHPGLISKIIMLFFKNSYIKKYWCSNKVFFLTFIIFYQVLSGKFTHSIHNMAYVAYGSKRSSCRAFFFSKKVNCYILQAYNKLGLPNQRIKYLGKNLCWGESEHWKFVGNLHIWVRLFIFYLLLLLLLLFFSLEGFKYYHLKLVYVWILFFEEGKLAIQWCLVLFWQNVLNNLQNLVGKHHFPEGKYVSTGSNIHFNLGGTRYLPGLWI